MATEPLYSFWDGYRFAGCLESGLDFHYELGVYNPRGVRAMAGGLMVTTTPTQVYYDSAGIGHSEYGPSCGILEAGFPVNQEDYE